VSIVKGNHDCVNRTPEQAPVNRYTPIFVQLKHHNRNKRQNYIYLTIVIKIML